MKYITIPKKSGGTRSIVVPNKYEKSKSVAVLNELNKLQIALNMDCVYGFVPGKNICDCASRHIGFRYTLNMDLKDFFDSVMKRHIDYLKDKRLISDRCMSYIMSVSNLERVARQGLPHSPALANLAARNMDQSILFNIQGKNIVYTRYADDLTFSGNDKEQLLLLRDTITNIASLNGFKINANKTRFQSAGKDGNITRIIVGIGVNKTGILLNRKKKRKLRSLAYQLNKQKFPNSPIRRQYAGYLEFSKLKPCQKQVDDLTLRKEIAIKLLS